MLDSTPLRPMYAPSPSDFSNRTFAVMDNLRFLRSLPGESVDLISIDPPFGKMDTFTSEAKPSITRAERCEERDLFLAHGLSLADEQQRKQLMGEGGSLVDDTFTWDNDVSCNRSHKDFYDSIEDAVSGSMARRIHRVIEAVRETAGDNQAAYICFMAASFRFPTSMAARCACPARRIRRSARSAWRARRFRSWSPSPSARRTWKGCRPTRLKVC